MTNQSLSNDEIKDIAEMLYQLRRYGVIGTKVDGVTYLGDWTPERIAAEKQAVLNDMKTFLRPSLDELCDRLPKVPLQPDNKDFPEWAILAGMAIVSAGSLALWYWAIVSIRHLLGA